MRADFFIEVGWHPWTDDNLSRAEAAAFCELEIVAGGVALTRNMDDRGVMRKGALVSALPFAWWLCANFWRICHEPDLPKRDYIPICALENWRIAHCMTSIGDGYAWPEITFVADGDEMRIRCQDQDSTDRRNQPMRYVTGLETICPKGQFMAQALNLVRATAERVGGAEPEFAALREQFEEELANEDAANYRILEAMLGHDAGYGPEALMARVAKANERIGWDALCEVCGGLNPVYGVEFASQTSDLERALSGMDSGVNVRVDLPRMEVKDAAPWEAGRRMARRVRELTGVGPEKPIGRTELLDWMGLGQRRFNRIATTGPVGVSRVKGKEASLVFPGRCSGKYAASRLFQLARALGGLLSLPASSRCMVMSASQTADQQIQRNFAAEFMAPIAALKTMLPARPTKKDIESIARHFHSSPQTIVHSLVNQGFLDATAGQMLLA